MINLAPKQEINDEWEQIKTATVDAARDVIQHKVNPQETNGGMKNARKSFKKKRNKEKVATIEDKNKLEHIH